MQYKYFITDVFTDRIFQGAQIAVFPQAEGLDRPTMQLIAKEMNLSETVFIINEGDADNHYRLITFTPTKELDFAGHTLVAAAWVLASINALQLEAEHTPIIFEQNSGPSRVHITTENGEPRLAQFSMDVVATADRFVPTDRELADILSLELDDLAHKLYEPLMIFCGRNYLVIPVINHQAVRKARFNYKAWSSSSAPSTLARDIILMTPTAGISMSDFHTRIMGPDIGHVEDPPIGTTMPVFTAYLCQHEHIAKGTQIFTVDRGVESTRRSQINIEMDNKLNNELVIRVGGPAVMVAEGQINLP